VTDTIEELERHRLGQDELRRKQDEDLRHVLAEPQGRRLLWRLIDSAGTFGASYAGEPQATAFNEGRRSVGIALMLEAQRVAQARYVQMLQEVMPKPEPE
jgi:hypothetical protein